MTVAAAVGEKPQHGVQAAAQLLRRHATVHRSHFCCHTRKSAVAHIAAAGLQIRSEELHAMAHVADARLAVRFIYWSSSFR